MGTNEDGVIAMIAIARKHDRVDVMFPSRHTGVLTYDNLTLYKGLLWDKRKS